MVEATPNLLRLHLILGAFSHGEQENKQFSWFRTDYLDVPNGTSVMERMF